MARSRFPSTERPDYSDGVVKAKNAVDGAAGILTIMLPEDQKQYSWAWVVPQIRMGKMRRLDAPGNPHNAFPQLRAGALPNQRSAGVLFTGATKFLDQGFAGARAGKPQAFALPSNARIHTASALTEINSPTSLAILQGPIRPYAISTSSKPSTSTTWEYVRRLMAITCATLWIMLRVPRGCWRLLAH